MSSIIVKLKRAFAFYRKNGFKRGFYRFIEKSTRYNYDFVRPLKLGGSRFGKDILMRRALYPLWISLNEPNDEALQKQREDARNLKYKPLISIVVPTFNTPVPFLKEMAGSLLAQTYPNWELCIADGGTSDPKVIQVLKEYASSDARIKVRFLEKNAGIVGNTNAALEMAEGEFIGLLDHDDTLAPFALYEVVSLINGNMDADMIYSDEDKIDEKGKKRYEVHFKPDWSPDTLRSYNYITHFLVLKTTLLKETGGFREGYDGSQDYDLILRASEKANSIHHISKVLYHWRISNNSTAGNPYAKLYAYDAAKKALADHLNRIGLSGDVEDGQFLSSYHVKYKLNADPLVTIIIPNKDQVALLKRCVESIRTKSTYKNYELLIVENGSSDPATLSYYEELSKQPGKTQIIRWDKPFNYAAINNFAVDFAHGEILLFLNNDMEVITEDWLENMLIHAVREDVGAVGAKLYYPDDRIQHAGLILGINGVAGHSHKYFYRYSRGYASRLSVVQNLSAVTGACLMMRKNVFMDVGGFDEGFAVAFNDVDLCVKIREKRYLIVWTPFSELYHHESASRGYEDTPEKKARFDAETNRFLEKWEKVLSQGDPYYNTNLTNFTEDFSLKIS